MLLNIQRTANPDLAKFFFNNGLQTDKWTDKQTDRWTDGQINSWTSKSVLMDLNCI